MHGDWTIRYTGWHPILGKKRIPALMEDSCLTITFETIHLFIAFIPVPFFVYILITGHPRAAGFILAVDVLVNGYPILVQRYNRGRIFMIFNKIAKLNPHSSEILVK